MLISQHLHRKGLLFERGLYVLYLQRISVSKGTAFELICLINSSESTCLSWGAATLTFLNRLLGCRFGYGHDSSIPVSFSVHSLCCSHFGVWFSVSWMVGLLLFFLWGVGRWAAQVKPLHLGNMHPCASNVYISLCFVSSFKCLFKNGNNLVWKVFPICIWDSESSLTWCKILPVCSTKSIWKCLFASALLHRVWQTSCVFVCCVKWSLDHRVKGFSF